MSSHDRPPHLWVAAIMFAWVMGYILLLFRGWMLWGHWLGIDRTPLRTPWGW